MLALFTVGVSGLMIAAAVMFGLGDPGHDRRPLDLKWGGGGKEFYRTLIVVALLGAAVCWSLRTVGFSRFWLLFGGLLCWMALDDLLMFHEKFADWFTTGVLGLPEEHLVTKHLNDALVAVDGPIAIGLAFGHRHSLGRLRWMILTMLPGVLCFVSTVIADFVEASQWTEESLKFLAEAFILSSFITTSLELREASTAMPDPHGPTRPRPALSHLR